MTPAQRERFEQHTLLAAYVDLLGRCVASGGATEECRNLVARVSELLEVVLDLQKRDREDE